MNFLSTETSSEGVTSEESYLLNTVMVDCHKTIEVEKQTTFYIKINSKIPGLSVNTDSSLLCPVLV